MGFLMGGSGTESAFWGCALFGTVFFALRVAMMVFGGFGAHDMDGGHHDGDLHGAGHGVGHGDADGHHSSQLQETDPSFKLFTINTITGFFMMFGWSGLTAYKQFGLGAGLAIPIALAAGLVTMVATAAIFRGALRLQSSGAQFDAAGTVGAKANVYVKIPAGGKGQVQLSHNGVTRTLDALAEDGSEIPSFQGVVVVKAVDSKTVTVKRA